MSAIEDTMDYVVPKFCYQG